MPGQIIQWFKFPYAVKYIPPRGRKVRTTLVVGRGCLSFRSSTPTEAPVAFIISSHSDYGYVGPIEIRRFEDCFWWPVIDVQGPLTLQSFANELNGGSGYYLRLLDPSLESGAWYLLSEGDLKARQIFESRQNEMLARAQRGSVQFLVCDDIIFMKGGEPTYICDLHYIGSGDAEARASTITVVDPKRLYEDANWSPSPFGGCRRFVFDVYASEGAVFRADEIEKAQIFYAAHDAKVFCRHTIEIINGEKIHGDPLEHQMAATIRLMACWLPADTASNSPIVSTLRGLAEMDDVAMGVGTRTLCSFISWFEQEQIPLNSKLHSSYKLAVKTIERIQIECTQRGVTPPFLNEEEAALESLAT